MPNGPAKAADEFVYRRIAVKSAISGGWIGNDGAINPAAFYPNAGDTTGLSFSRGATFIEAAATAPVGRHFYLVQLRVSDLTRFPLDFDSPTHAQIIGWTVERRKDKEIREGAEYLASICSKPEGPFEGQSPVE